MRTVASDYEGRILIGNLADGWEAVLDAFFGVVLIVDGTGPGGCSEKVVGDLLDVNSCGV